jgi:hypothetical protein
MHWRRASTACVCVCVHFASPRGVTSITICLIKMQCMRFLCSQRVDVTMHAADLFPCNMHKCSFSLHARIIAASSCVCVCNRFGKHSTPSFACRQLDLWQDATFVVRVHTQHVMWRYAWLRRKATCSAGACVFFCQSHLLMKLYVHVCCRRKTHFWITTCPASSRYLRTNDRDSAGYLLISVSTTLLIHFF